MNDETGRRIDDLIEQASDPVMKAILLVQHKMERNIESAVGGYERMTELIVAYRNEALVSASKIEAELAAFRKDFEAHDKQESLDRAKIDGARWATSKMFAVVLAVLGITSAFGGYILKGHDETAKDLAAKVAKMEQEIVLLKRAER